MPLIFPSQVLHRLKKKNHYIFSSQLRADQMPGPPREIQLTNDFCLDSHHTMAGLCIGEHDMGHQAD